MALKIGNKALFYHIPKTARNWVRIIIEKEGKNREEKGQKSSNKIEDQHK